MAYYSFGSGMVGCLYDNGPHFCESKEDAIGSLVETFGDLPEEELSVMVQSLERDGIHYFSDPVYAGAHYAEVNEQSGDLPGEDF